MRPEHGSLFANTCHFIHFSNINTRCVASFRSRVVTGTKINTASSTTVIFPASCTKRTFGFNILTDRCTWFTGWPEHESVDSPSCAKTFGRTFSCQAAAAAAVIAASRAQRSSSMALVTVHRSTSLDHMRATAARRAGHVRAGRAAAGGGLARRGCGAARGDRGRARAAGAPRSRMRGAAECGPRT